MHECISTVLTYDEYYVVGENHLHSSLMLTLLEWKEFNPDAPQAFLQTDPEDRNPDENRASSLKVALGLAVHVVSLKTHAHEGFMVAPAELVDQESAYVRLS